MNASLADIEIYEQTEAEWPDVWRVIGPAFRAGESYPLPRNVSEEDAKRYWIKTDGFNAVARDHNGAVLGVYYLRPDQGGPGDHICNAGYVIAEAARGRGLATALCLQSQDQARAIGFRGMKFNLVVSTNEAAVKAWKKAGMEVIGTVPGAFRHPASGFVDAYIMFRALQEKSMTQPYDVEFASQHFQKWLVALKEAAMLATLNQPQAMKTRW